MRDIFSGDVLVKCRVLNPRRKRTALRAAAREVMEASASPASNASSLRLLDNRIGWNDFKADRDWTIEKSFI